jgi:hypothetical protein
MITPEIIEKIKRLTPRQYFIFEKLGEGLHPCAIYNYPGNIVSHKTYETHFTKLKKNLNMRSAVNLYVLAGAWKEYCDVNKVTLVPQRRFHFHNTLEARP